MRIRTRVFSLSIATTLLLLALIVVGGACAPSAMADAVYTYTGTPYTTCFGTYVSSCSSISLTGTLDLSLSTSQLENLDNFILPASDIVSFSFTDGFAASLNQSTAAFSEFIISTNSQGQITQWVVVILSGVPAAGAIGHETGIGLVNFIDKKKGTKKFGSGSGNDILADCTLATAPPTGCTTIIDHNDLEKTDIIDGGFVESAGTWSLQGSTAPTPEPSSLLLLGTGLLALGPFIRHFART